MPASHRCSVIVCSSASRPVERALSPRQRSGLALALVLGLASGGDVGCRRGPSHITISRLVIDAPREYDQAPEARAALRSAIEERLTHDGSVGLDATDRSATHTVQVRLGALVGELPDEAPADGQAEAALDLRVVEVRLRPLGEGPLFETAAVAKGAGEVVPVLAAFDEAWALMIRLRRLEGEPDATLLTALRDPDARVRDFAIVRLGERKSVAAVPALCALLDSETKPELVLRAVGSLVAIGDERAAVPIIELSKRKDLEFVLQLVYAVGAIGGRTAEAYLVTMASGHPVEAVRRGAEQALHEMRRPSAAKRAGTP